MTHKSFVELSKQMVMKMYYSTITNQGSCSLNEDSIGVIKSGNLTCFVVADGLGGHGRGDTASQTAVRAFTESFSNPGVKCLPELLSEAFLYAQTSILKEQRLGDMKTTAVALVLQNRQAVWGHIGDSRLYAFRNNRVKLRTIDHSVPQMLALSGEIKERDIRSHPDRNLLLRVLGVDGEAPRYEMSETYPVDKFQAFLLCSDGFWELITEKEMERLLKKSSTPEEWLEQMLSIVKDRGHGRDMDNYSAISVFV